MGLFNGLNKEERERREEIARQELMSCSEKELLVEILLELRKLNKQSERIRRNQVIWSD